MLQDGLGLQRRWLQQNPFAGAVLDDPTLPLPRFIRDTQQQQQQQQRQRIASDKTDPIALKDALQRVKVLSPTLDACIALAVLLRVVAGTWPFCTRTWCSQTRLT